MPNIGDFMDTGGMIICEAEVQTAIADASAAQYEALATALRAAKPQAASFMDIEKRAAEMIKASL